MYDSIFMQKHQTFYQWSKRIDDLLLLKIDNFMASSSVLQFSFNVGDSPRVEQTVVVDDGSDEGGVGNLGMEWRLGWCLEILVGFLSVFMVEEDVVGFKADYAKLFGVCSIVHLRIYLLYVYSINSYLHSMRKNATKRNKHHIIQFY